MQVRRTQRSRGVSQSLGEIGLVAAGATWAFGRHFSFDPLLASKNLPSISLTVVFDSLLKKSDFFGHHFATDGSFFEKAS